MQFRGRALIQQDRRETLSLLPRTSKEGTEWEGENEQGQRAGGVGHWQCAITQSVCMCVIPSTILKKKKAMTQLSAMALAGWGCGLVGTTCAWHAKALGLIPAPPPQ